MAMSDGLLPRGLRIDGIQRERDFDQFARRFNWKGHGLDSFRALKQRFEVVVDRSHPPAGLLSKWMRHVVECLDAIIFSDENDSEVVLGALVPTLKDFVLGHRHSGCAFDTTFYFDVAG